MLTAGSTLQNGRYVVESMLGSGGMGGVYRAHDQTLDRKVAIKQMHLEGSPADRRQSAAALEHEARLLARLRHANVVGVNDFFSEDEAHYLVMDFIEGRDLQSIVSNRAGPANLEEVQVWLEQICDALEYLHGSRILMRDLKPSNVMLDSGGRIRLIDFGIARVERSGDRTASAIKGYGTEGYAPVEQYGQGHTDVRSDIYALGATLYTLICGTRPPESVSLATGDAVLALPSTVHAEVGPVLDKVILKMLSTRKEDRHPTVAEARHALRTAFLKPKGATSAPLSTTSVFSLPGAQARPVELPHGPVIGPEGLRHLEPYSVVYSGDLDGAKEALEKAEQAGMKTQMLPSKEPFLTARPGYWIVIVQHPPVAGGRDAWTRQSAS